MFDRLLNKSLICINTLDLIITLTASSVVMHTSWENESRHSYSARKVYETNNNATYTIHSVINHKILRMLFINVYNKWKTEWIIAQLFLRVLISALLLLVC